jgi:PEP-CTERM motif
MIKRALGVFALAAALAVPVQTQAQVNGSFTVGGSSGNWLLSFTFTNNTAGEYLYTMGGQNGGAVSPLNAYEIVATAAPSDWVAPSVCLWYGGWSIGPDCTFNAVFSDGIANGATLGGFTATYASDIAPEQLLMKGRLAFDTPNLGTREASFTAYRATAVPEPGSMMLLAAGLFGLVAVRLRRQPS